MISIFNILLQFVLVVLVEVLNCILQQPLVRGYSRRDFPFIIKGSNLGVIILSHELCVCMGDVNVFITMATKNAQLKEGRGDNKASHN